MGQYYECVCMRNSQKHNLCAQASSGRSLTVRLQGSLHLVICLGDTQGDTQERPLTLWSGRAVELNISCSSISDLTSELTVVELFIGCPSIRDLIGEWGDKQAVPFPHGVARESSDASRNAVLRREGSCSTSTRWASSGGKGWHRS